MRDSGAEGGPAPEGGHDDGGGVWPVDAQARMPAACSTEEEEDGGFGGGRGGGGRELRRRRPCGSGGPRAEATPARAGLAERVGALLGGKGVMVAVVGNGGERWRGLSLLVFGGEFCCSGFEGKGWQLAKLLG